MEYINKSNKIALLFDSYSIESSNLHASFKALNIDILAISLEDDGFLPDDVTSPYQHFLGDFDKCKNAPGKPLYFNQIKVPQYWEITGTNGSGKVMNYTKEAARIFYAEPKHKRLVKIVDWIDEKGNVRLSDHYNKYGAIFCRTAFNKSAQKVNRTFFDVNGLETIHENFVTGSIVLTKDGKDKIFRNKNEFYLFYLQEIKVNYSNLFFNTLSTSFFMSLGLPNVDSTDALFWNEDVKDEIPGNMLNILNNPSIRARRVFVQKKAAYNRLIELGASSDIVKELGYIYEFERSNRYGTDALICTNSDQVLELEKLVTSAPKVKFHVAALTEMSERLMKFESYENVTLYPNANQKTIDKLMNQCDLYLDINRESEIVDAVHRAFLNNMLILGFDETLHNKNYIAPENVFKVSEVDGLVFALKNCIENPTLLDMALDNQRKAALSCDIDDYRAYFG